jgi:hypothetical protein
MQVIQLPFPDEKHEEKQTDGKNKIHTTKWLGRRFCKLRMIDV